VPCGKSPTPFARRKGMGPERERERAIERERERAIERERERESGLVLQA
jgi:hypothetical protein